jgi:ribosome modulation factor
MTYPKEVLLMRDNLEEAYNMGWDAYLDGIEDPPNDLDPTLLNEWLDGWDDAHLLYAK